MKPATTPAQQAATQLGPISFYVQKGMIVPMLHAIVGRPGQPPYIPPTPGLQDRTDISGKFARRMGQNRRALEKANAIVEEEMLALVKEHAERFPKLQADGSPHPKAGEFTPVYQTNEQTGEPVFKKDERGLDTDERIALPDRYNIADMAAFKVDQKEFLREIIVVVCAGFEASEFEAFKSTPGQNSPIGRIVDPLMDLERDGATTRKPADFDAGESAGPALVKDDVVKDDADTSDEATAP